MGEIGEHCERAKQNINNPEKSETLGVMVQKKVLKSTGIN